MIAGAEDEEYLLTLEDIGSSLVFMYTPVTKEGTQGEPLYAITEFVIAGIVVLPFIFMSHFSSFRRLAWSIQYAFTSESLFCFSPLPVLNVYEIVYNTYHCNFSF